MTNDMALALSRPFKASEISIRLGSSFATSDNQIKAVALLYIERQTAQRRLDDVCSQFGYSWSTEKEVVEHTPNRVVVQTMLKLSGNTETVVRSEYGEASADSRGMELFKVASSDSFKRVASEFGVGRYLYATPNVWFDVDSKGKFVKSHEEIIETLYKRMGLDEYVDFDRPDLFKYTSSDRANAKAERFAERVDKSEKFSNHREATEGVSGQTQREAVPATEKQVSLIEKLISVKLMDETQRASYTERLQGGLTKKEASQLIDELQDKAA
jgi:hypothetical protein